jgi:hypothetical protein
MARVLKWGQRLQQRFLPALANISIIVILAQDLPGTDPAPSAKNGRARQCDQSDAGKYPAAVPERKIVYPESCKSPFAHRKSLRAEAFSMLAGFFTLWAEKDLLRYFKFPRNK